MKLRPDDETNLLVGLLEQYSPTGSESGAVSYLVKKMQALGFHASIDGAGNAMGSLGQGPKEIVLLGHIDTVPGVIPVQLDGDRLLGRGAVDAKGPLACFVAAAAGCRVPAGWKVSVVGAVGEEGDSRGAKFLVGRTPPEMAMIGEPSGWDRIAIGYKGSAWFDYQINRGQAHTASGIETACEASVAFWNRLREKTEVYNADKAKVFEQITPVLREMSSTQSGFDQIAALKIGIRLPEAISPAEIEKWLRAVGQDGELTMSDSIPAFRAGKNTPLVRALLASIRKAGGQPGFTLKTGTADMNLVGPAWGCPILAYGPGDSALDHTPDEHILVSEYLASVRVLAAALCTLQN